MKDSTRRGLRTGFDVTLSVLGALAAILLIPGINDQFQQAGLGQVLFWFGLIVLILTTFVTKLKNALEDAGVIPAVLKAPASDGANPAPNNANGGVI